MITTILILSILSIIFDWYNALKHDNPMNILMHVIFVIIVWHISLIIGIIGIIITLLAIVANDSLDY